MEKIMRLYRLSRFLYLHKVPILPKVISRIIRFLFAAEIPYTCNIGQGVQLKHGGLGVVLHDRTIIGDNSKIGANAVVVKDVNENSTVVGVPAKQINYEKS